VISSARKCICGGRIAMVRLTATAEGNVPLRLRFIVEVLSPSARLVLLHDAMRESHKKPALLCQNPNYSWNFFPQAGQAPQAKLPASRHLARNEI
jgi:hypothetical protein